MNEDTNNNLIWLDLEMTGVGDEHVILEVAIIITDEKLNITDRFPDSKLGLAIKRSEDELSEIEPWSLNQHTKSGLLERSRESECDIKKAQDLALNFIQTYIKRPKTNSEIKVITINKKSCKSVAFSAIIPEGSCTPNCHSFGSLANAVPIIKIKREKK